MKNRTLLRSVGEYLIFRFFNEEIEDFVQCYTILEKDEIDGMFEKEQAIFIKTKSSEYKINKETFICEKIDNQGGRYLRPNEHFIFDNPEKYQKITSIQQKYIKKTRKIEKYCNDRIEKIYRAFGEDITLLQIRYGDKRPTTKGWPFITWKQSQEESYQKSLINSNIGIHCGDQSNGLCSIDLDSEESQKIFIDLNPKLKNTVKTKGSRGCNYWVKIKGNCPIVRHFVFGDLVGEFRGSGGQTVVSGLHPSGNQYQIIEGEIPEIYFNELNFPENTAQNIFYHWPYYFNNVKFLDIFDYNFKYISKLKRRAKLHSKECWRINNKTFFKVNTEMDYFDVYEKIYKKYIEYGTGPANQ